MNKFGKIGRSIMVGALVLGMSVPVFADITAPDVGEGTKNTTIEAGVTGQEVESEATLTLPTISVTIPTTHGFILNPYNLEGVGQILASEATITNESDVAVEVSLKSTEATILPADKKLQATLGAVTEKTSTKMIELNLMVEAAGAEEIHAEKTLITGKNKEVKLATLPADSGSVKLNYEGQAVANPVGNPWTSADTISVSSIYTFTPVVNVAP